MRLWGDAGQRCPLMVWSHYNKTASSLVAPHQTWVWSLVSLRPRRWVSTMAPPTCQSAELLSLLSLSTSLWQATQVSVFGKHHYNTTFWINFGDFWFSNMPKNICLPMFTGNPMTAVYAISANRPGYSDYFVLSPPSSYRSPSWMSYPPEPEDLPHQWNDTVKASSVSIYSSSSVTNPTRWLLTHLVLWPHYLHILLLSSKNQQPTFIHLDCLCCVILKVNVIFFLLKLSYRTSVTWRPSAELESFLMLSRHSHLPGYFGVLDY